MRKAVIALSAVAAVAAAAVLSVPLAERYFADSIKTQLDRDGVFTAGTVEVGLFDRRIAMRDLKERQGSGISASRWEASGLAWPLGELLAGRTPISGWRLGDPLHAERVEADGLLVALPYGEKWSFGKVVLDGVDIDRFDAGVAPGPSQLSIVAARLVQAASVRGFEERDVIHTMARGGNTIGFASLTGSRLEHGLFGTFDLAAFEATGKTAAESSFRLQSVKGDGFDLRRMLAAMSAPSWRPGNATGRLSIDHAVATGFGGELLTRYGITLDRVALDATHAGDKVTRTLRIEGFAMVPPARGAETMQTRLVMQAMGLKELRLDLDCAGHDDRPKGEATVDRCVLTGQDLGTLTLGLKFVNADEAFWRAIDSGNMLAGYGSSVAFGQAKITIADKGLLERSARAIGLSLHKTPAAARADLATEIRRYAPPNVLITEDMTKLLETVASFVDKGGTLTLEAQPDPPLGVAKLAVLLKPGPDLVSLLGLTATVSK
jgi:hypothetical protein